MESKEAEDSHAAAHARRGERVAPGAAGGGGASAAARGGGGGGTAGGKGGATGAPREETAHEGELGATGASKTGARVDHARSTVVRKGEIFARPYKTSAKPFQREYPTAVVYGSVDPIMNPPKLFTKSVSASTYSAKKRMTAGTVKKQPEPYHPNAARNRLKVEFKRLPPPFVSKLELGHGVPAVGHNGNPYMTTNKFAQRQVRKPMHARTGFTNPGITADLAKRAHKGALS